MSENILTIREVADLLKINEKTIYKLAAASKIPGVKVGGSWRFDRTTISSWISTKSAADMAVANDGADAEPEQPAEAMLASAHYSPQQGTFFAHRITLEGTGEDALAQSLSTARVDMNPHQVDAALFALASPLSKGVLLADEVGLGKTIEASLVIAQRWAERRRRILLIVPASLRKQWSQELYDKFSLPSVIVERKSYNDAAQEGRSPGRSSTTTMSSSRPTNSLRSKRTKFTPASGTWWYLTKRTACATSTRKKVGRAPSACATPRGRSSRF